jgi:diguanylate cyclase
MLQQPRAPADPSGEMLARAQIARDGRMPPIGKRWLVHAVLAVLVLAYIALLLVRPPTDVSTLIDGWGVNTIEFCAGVVCLLAARRHRRTRLVPVMLGLGALSWAAGDVAATLLAPSTLSPPSPTLADAGYLGFFPCAFAAIALYTRADARRLGSAQLLDGAIAGLGAAAVCAAVVFSSVAEVTHRSVLGTAVSLAYPVGDVVLLLLVVGGAAMASGRRLPWLLLGVAFSINALGDTSNLLQASSSRLGAVLSLGAWPVSVVIVAVAVWLAPRPRDPMASERSAGFLLPGLAAGAGILVLLLGTVVHVRPVASVIAAATLLAVVLRMGLSVRELRAHTQERHRQSRTDQLTGLGNRRRLTDTLDPIFTSAPSARPSLAFLFIDLNRFKQVNDFFGHPAGDEILRQVAVRLAESVQPSDLVVRIGGDEFGVVLVGRGSGAAQAQATAARIGARLAEPFAFGGVTAEIGASIGIALSEDAGDAAALIANADAAMYEAKLEGRPLVFYATGLERGDTRLRLADELRLAIENDELVLFFQPQLDVRSGDLTAAEALVRWQHPTRGLVPPQRFLSLAAEAGLMDRLTRWVLATALDRCAQWQASGHALAVSVNVSVEDLLDPGFPAMVDKLLARSHLSPSSLMIEITETSVIDEFDRARDAIGRLSEIGVHVSIDDFGAGFTSLAYLSELPVAELKLDRRFIAPLAGGSGGRQAELVRAVVQLGHALGLRVVAEGVEDQPALELLGSLGCDLVQGYTIARPLPVAEFEALLGEWGEPGCAQDRRVVARAAR